MTINFFLYLSKEINLLNFDFNALLSEPFVILLYIQIYILYLIYATIIYIIIRFKHSAKNLFKSLLIFGLKIFNIVYPLLFLVLLSILDKLIDTGKLEISIIESLTVCILLIFSLYLLFINTIRLLPKFYKIKYIKLFSAILVLMTFFINYKSFEIMPFKNNILSIIHIDNLCKQKIDRELKKSKCQNCELSHSSYIKLLVSCEENSIKIFNKGK
ncbi:hypothetical protein [Malaciobacter pacificus]|uniref:Uncharacterized protein n=2 Tax=Malaciobacter pacificus TaxID=1080223 RepID=A0A5C2H6Z8_9BACT|nr:hypothetical protein [Malaciobacter pacificus]QEP34731.1 hypothetical protein APAC_1635 [Malaciobacter pacificus]